jgi:hypothetical protein
MWTGHAFRELFEEWIDDLLELFWFDYVQYLLDFAQIHHL